MTSVGMLQSFTTYCLGVFHPNKIHRQWRESQLHRRKSDVSHLSMSEAVTYSWIFVVLHATLQVIFLDVIVSEISILEKLPFAEFRQFFIPSLSFSAQAFYLYFLTLKVLFFPLGALILAKYWVFVLQLVGELLDDDEIDEQAAEDIVALSFSSYLFRFIPILGEPLQELWRSLILLMGIRTRYDLSWFFSFVVFFFPGILLSLFLLSAFIGLAILPQFFMVL